MKKVCLFLLTVCLCRAARAEAEAPLYDLSVRLQKGDACLVKHSGENVGTMIVGGRKIVSSVKGSTRYEIRVLDVENNAIKVRLTFRGDETRGTSGGVTLYAPFSSAVTEPTNQISNGDAIKGQSEELNILSNGFVTSNLSAPFPLLRQDYNRMNTAQKAKARREIAAFEMKRQTTEKFRFFVGARPTKSVALGDRWRGDFRLKTRYATRHFDVSYTLTKVENNVAFVATSTRELPEKSPTNAMPNMKDTRGNLQSGTLQIDLKNGWPLRAKENGQSFSRLQTVEKTPRNVLSTYGKSRSQVETAPLPASSAQ